MLKRIAIGFVTVYLAISAIASTIVSFGGDYIITQRKPFLIVEVVVGTVTNEDLSGVDHRDYYIGYRNTNAKLADKVLTFMVWNPLNDYEDDIIARFDFIIGSEVKG